MFYGLSNQRWSILKALVTAQMLNFTLVLPQWCLDYNESGGADYLPFDYFYSSKHLIEYARQHHHLTIVHSLPAHLTPTCVSQAQNSRQNYCPEPFGKSMRAWASKHGVVCLSAVCTFKHRLEGMPFQQHLDTYRPALQPSRLFELEVEAVLELLHQRYNTTRYVTVHVRTEADWLGSCAGGALPVKGFACYATEQEISKYLRPHAPAGSLLFIASGDPISVMPNLCSRYRCWKREELRPQLGPGIVNKLTARAFVDFLLARHGMAFYGNKYSTFSMELYAEFKRCGLGPAGYYNTPLPPSPPGAASRPPPPPPPVQRLPSSAAPVGLQQPKPKPGVAGGSGASAPWAGGIKAIAAAAKQQHQRQGRLLLKAQQPQRQRREPPLTVQLVA